MILEDMQLIDTTEESNLVMLNRRTLGDLADVNHVTNINADLQ